MLGRVVAGLNYWSQTAWGHLHKRNRILNLREHAGARIQNKNAETLMPYSSHFRTIPICVEASSATLHMIYGQNYLYVCMYIYIYVICIYVYGLKHV